jgi:hypothetical protein
MLTLEDINGLKFGRYHKLGGIIFDGIIHIKNSIIAQSGQKWYYGWVTINDMLDLYEIPKFEYESILETEGNLLFYWKGDTICYNIDKQFRHFWPGKLLYFGSRLCSCISLIFLHLSHFSIILSPLA